MEGIALAAQYGFEFTSDEWNDFNYVNEERPLSEQELESVAGGGQDNSKGGGDASLCYPCNPQE